MLSITRIEIKESMIYGEGHRYSSSRKAWISPKIELEDATVASCKIKSLENSVQSGVTVNVLMNTAGSFEG